MSKIPEEPEDYGLSSHELKYQAEQVMSAEEVDAPVARSNPHSSICNARSRTLLLPLCPPSLGRGLVLFFSSSGSFR
jgi:hypothetical protein